MTIKFLELPHLVVREVFDNFDIIDVFEFSQCSKEAAKMQQSAYMKSYKIQLDFSKSFIMVDGKLEIRIVDGDLDEGESFRRFEDCEQKVEFHPTNKNRMVTFWSEKYVGFRKILMHLFKMFYCNTESIRSGSYVPGDEYLEIVKFVLQKQTEIEALDLRALFTGDSAKWILENLRVTKNLQICINYFPESVKPEPFPFESVHETIEIQNASWITVAHLKAMTNCGVLQLHETSLTKEDVLEFLGIWKSGGYPKLEYLRLESRQLPDNFTLPGHVRLSQEWNGIDDPEPTVAVKKIYGDYISINGTVGIKTDNGVPAKIRYHSNEHRIEMMVFQ